MLNPLYFVGGLILLSSQAYAEIVTDGTLGQRLSLPAPNYQITQDLGKTVGTNLFHSFEQFNLHPNETATFSGSTAITNVISRITGGNSSTIDGTLRNIIPHADTYLINPAGIVFGANARLDVQGGFHVSTADYLRLQDGGKFNARQPVDTLLTTAPVEAFGFITDLPSPLLVTDSQLSLRPQTKFSLIGGALTLTHANIQAPLGQITLASVTQSSEVIPTVEHFTRATLQGNITVTDQSRLETSGEGGGSIIIRGGKLVIKDSQIYAQTLANKTGHLIDIQANQIDLLEGTEINTETHGSGNSANINLQAHQAVIIAGKNSAGANSQILANSRSEAANSGKAGDIIIQAGEILLADDAYLSVGTAGSGKGGNLVLKSTGTVTLLGDGSKPLTEIDAGTLSHQENAGEGGNIFIEAQNIILTDGAIIDIAARGKGNSGEIVLRAQERISLTGTGGSPENSAKLKAYAAMSSSGGNAGNVLLEASEILLADGAYINASTFAPGEAGSITLKAPNGIISLVGSKDEGWATWVGSGSHARVEGIKTGRGGNILVEAGELRLSEGATIASSSVADKDKRSSAAGNITIRVTGTVKLSGVNIHGETEDGFGSGIYVYTRGVEDSAGNGGMLDLEAGNLIIENGAVISSSTSGNAKGGDITIKITNSILVSGDSAAIQLISPGEIQLAYRKDFNKLEPDYSISGIYAKSSGSSDSAGEAGQIAISTPVLKLTNGGMINTSTQNAGGGNIIMKIPQLIYLPTSQITTSVHGGKGNGGNVTIETPRFTVLDNSSIVAQADEGYGGNIRIVAEHFLKSPDSLISASSRLGIDGEVRIHFSDKTINGNLLTLATNFQDNSQHLTECRANFTINRSRFKVNFIAGVPNSPEDFQSSQSLLPITFNVYDNTSKSEIDH
jgi:filamentous hemagglutinin family protein